MIHRKSRIISDPKILGGKPIIEGTRISVELVLDLLSSGWTNKQIVDDYSLKKDDIIACFEYAKDAVKVTRSIPLASQP